MSIHRVSNATGRSPAAALMGAFALLTLFTPTAAQAQVSRPGSQTPAKVRDGTAKLVEHRDPAKMLRLAIVLMPPHMAEERQFLEDVQDKTSPLFHQFLTADQWNARFSPAAGDEQAVVAWAASQGLRVTQRFPNRLVVDVEAPGGAIEKALGVQLNTYQVGDETHYSNDRDPVLPTALTPVVHSVLGLNSIEHDLPKAGAGRYVPRPDYVPGPTVQVGDSAQKDASPKTAGVLTPSTSGYRPADIFSSAAYDYGALMNLGHCCNPLNNPGVSPPEASIAIAAYGDVNLSDVGGFQAGFPYLAFNVQKIFIDGTYICALNKGVVDDDNCGEVTLDTEWSLAMANSQGSPANTAKVYVYEGVNANQNTVVTLLNTMQTDGHARVMSTSWSYAEFIEISETAMNARDFIYVGMVGQGWTLVAASGDQGATGACTDALAVQFPASDPNVVGVGGTHLTEIAGSNYEVAWTGGTTRTNPTAIPPTLSSCSTNHGGSTGGFSAFTPYLALSAVPSYQQSFGFIARAVPDMALNAADGHATYYNGGWASYLGTSVAAPMVAGFFAQENAYLLSIGNKCGSTSTAPCAPLGNANHQIYQVGLNPYENRSPFYDIVIGCNSNDITAQYSYNLTPYCAKPGYDEVTGWGSANMLQLAWAINSDLIAANGTPSISFSGPATNRWYNTNQTVNWTVLDHPGAFPGTGIAGETQGWDSIPADPKSEPHGGSGNSFYSGPQFPNSSTGCLAFEANGCSGGAPQGCHTVHVEGWNNQGLSTGDSTYGPLCYDTVLPTVSASKSPAANSAGWNHQGTTVTLNASDPGGAGASGIKATYYQFVQSGLPDACGAASLSFCKTYSGPFAVNQTGYSRGIYFTEDNAGNFSSPQAITVDIDETAPVTTSTVTGTFRSGAYFGVVTIALNATDNLSGVASTTVSLDGGPKTTYSGAMTVVALSAIGSHTLSYYSTDIAGNVETAHTINIPIL